MAENTNMAHQQPQPRNIFELINSNVVILSQNVAEVYDMVKEIHTVLFPPPQNIISEPNAAGTEEEIKK